MTDEDDSGSSDGMDRIFSLQRSDKKKICNPVHAPKHPSTLTNADDYDSDSSDKIFSLKRPKKRENYTPIQAEKAISLLTIQESTQPPHCSQQDASQVASQPKCDHPLFDLDIMDPQLTEDDIPGAKIDIHDIQRYKIPALVKWLQCRRLSTTGNKSDLVARILNHANNHKEHKIYQGFEGGIWYEKKRKRLMAEAQQANQKCLPMMPVGLDWKGRDKIYQPFHSVHIPNKYSSVKARDYLDLIPHIRFSHEGGVESAHEADGEDNLGDFSQHPPHERKNIFVDGTLKRANNIDSGRVLSIRDCIRNDHYFVKANVKASYMDNIYFVSIMISKASGDVCF